MCECVCCEQERTSKRNYSDSALKKQNQLLQRGDIEKTITICRGLDPRIAKNWFSF